MQTITLVTPSYNSATYIEATIRSVLAQDDPALQYIIVDGGSTDGTQAIIRRYAQHLHAWVSEPDDGMYDALNKGFALGDGEIMAWLNADDLYPAWTLRTVRAIFADLPQVDWITSIRPLLYDTSGQAVDCMALTGYSKAGFLRGEHTPMQAEQRHFQLEAIQQESTFWRRDLWQKVGGKLDTRYKLAADFELWARFYRTAELIGVRTVLGGFRVHPAQQSAQHAAAYSAEVQQIMQQYGIRSGLAPLRRLAPYVPARLRRPAGWLGITRPTQIATYNQADSRWRLRKTYI